MKIYIAGPISGVDNYADNFNKAEKKLQAEGYITLNPSILPGGLTQEEYMRICIPMLNVCDEIYMLDGWEDSVGSNIEFDLAKQANKKIRFDND